MSMFDLILSLDKNLFTIVNSTWTTGWADVFFPAITDLHKIPAVALLFLSALLYAFIRKTDLKKGLLIFVFAIFAVTSSDAIGNWGFKKTFQRPRPAETQGVEVKVRAPFGGYSFVSNHSLNSFTLASYSSAFLPAAALPLYTTAAFIAYSRVYNGVHFPSDVLVGGLLGVLWGLLSAALCRKVLKKAPSAKEKKT